MITKNIYISPEIQDEIKRATEFKLEEVMSSFVEFQRNGTSGLKCECHSCGRDGKTLQFQPRRRIAKCFHCEAGASSPISYLIQFEGYDYHGALVYLADRYNIEIEEKKQGREKITTSISFRDSQLMSSGIAQKYQKWNDRLNSTTEAVVDRYESGTLDQYGNIDYSGDDMLLHYLDLEGKPIYFTARGGKQKPMIRIRYQFPDQHKNTDGKPVKYRSPMGSGSHIWIPQLVIEAYGRADHFDTLIVTEGEKKADKLAIEGFLAVGIMGINNFNSQGEMPHHFTNILKKMKVKNVIFLLDTDWRDLAIHNDKSVDQRPRSFFTAVKKFRDYFYGFAPEIEVRIFFGHHFSGRSKGIDDFFMDELRGVEKTFKVSLEKAIIDREHTSELVQLYDITSISDYRLSEFWSIQSPAAFIDEHKDKLIALKEFSLAGLKRRVNEDGEIELAQKLLKHEQYWIENEFGVSKTGPKYSFDYVQIYYFLRNRGFGLFQPEFLTYRLIYIVDKVVTEIDYRTIQHFVRDFTAELEVPERIDIMRMLNRGMRMYLGPDSLSNMYYLNPNFYQPRKDEQYLFFKNKYVKITPDEIVIEPLNNLQFNIWSNQIIDFEPTLIEDYFKIIRKKNHFEVSANEGTEDNPGAFYRSEMMQFLYRTSLTNWKKYQKLIEVADGSHQWVGKLESEMQSGTQDEIKDTFAHLSSKIIALGYLLNDYDNRAVKKAVVAMDMVETEVGMSQGGTGKSLYSTMLQKIVPAFIIDGKSPSISKDDHLYEGVDERTKVIVFDDCRVNFDFEFLFSQITRGVTVNPKGKKKFTLPSPKFILNTNHAFNGEGNSFARRQYYVAFSDYYNEHRTPEDDFGHLLFDDWDHEQWNLFYNLIFVAIQTYFKFGLKYTIPVQNIENRKLRQRMGENFLEWAVNEWSKAGDWLNNHVEKKYAYDAFISDFPEERRYVNLRTFKKKVIMFCQYSGLAFNIDKDGGQIKSGNNEYLCVSDRDYSSLKADKIDNNISKPQIF